jgi:hypothetical protein
VNNNVAVVKGHPFTREQSFDAYGLDAKGDLNESLDLFGDCSHLSITSTRGDDQCIERVDEFSEV